MCLSWRARYASAKNMSSPLEAAAAAQAPPAAAQDEGEQYNGPDDCDDEDGPPFEAAVGAASRSQGLEIGGQGGGGGLKSGSVQGEP